MRHRNYRGGHLFALRSPPTPRRAPAGDWQLPRAADLAWTKCGNLPKRYWQAIGLAFGRFPKHSLRPQTGGGISNPEVKTAEDARANAEVYGDTWRETRSTLIRPCSCSRKKEPLRTSFFAHLPMRRWMTPEAFRLYDFAAIKSRQRPASTVTILNRSRLITHVAW